MFPPGLLTRGISSQFGPLRAALSSDTTGRRTGTLGGINGDPVHVLQQEARAARAGLSDPPVAGGVAKRFAAGAQRKLRR